MAWYWWLVIVGAVFGIISIVLDHGEPYEEESSGAGRLAALIIIDGLKYTHPEVWAKCASDIMGRPIDPPTPEQIAQWKLRKAEREAMNDTGLIR